VVDYHAEALSGLFFGVSGLNNQTPAQVAGVNLPLGENKWLDLIEMSARLKHGKS